MKIKVSNALATVTPCCISFSSNISNLFLKLKIYFTQAVLELASQLQDKLKTLTVDHGKEFANYQTIERQTGTHYLAGEVR